jgi:phosphoribosylglycinamide formyltransferase-1
MIRTDAPAICLVTEGAFHARYLVNRWTRRFNNSSQIRGIALRAESAAIAEPATETERIMLQEFGHPGELGCDQSSIVCLGTNLNAACARDWLKNLCAGRTLFVFVFLDQLLAPWWISTTDSRVVNAHSAVLPFARGMYAIEQLAAQQDPDKFAEAAGATVHYVDNTVDGGPIIRAERLIAPFEYRSIWELKAYALMLAFDLLISVAERLISDPQAVPVGLQVPSVSLGPCFRAAQFDTTARRLADVGYAAMKKLSVGTINHY